MLSSLASLLGAPAQLAGKLLLLLIHLLLTILEPVPQAILPLLRLLVALCRISAVL